MEITMFAIMLLFGAVVGSFLNVVILRLPEEGSSIVYPGSHCPLCKAPIHWYDNIPIVSYVVLLRGKCRSCKTGISFQYPLVELSMALLTGAAFHRFDLSFDLFYYFLFLAALLVIIFIDLKHQIIPDVLSLPGIIIGFGGAFFAANVSWLESLIGLLAGGGVLYLVALGYYLVTKRDGMGGGDIKLLAMIGAFLGWKSLLYVLFFSSFTGSIIGVTTMLIKGSGSQLKIPFGPFLSLGAITYLFFNDQLMQLWSWYLQFMAG
ncbi:MAG: prepilin peptidase [Desulfobacterales bacterium]|nr:MAG: prepilin peptidase [Desulfobacterales bacterium]